MAARTPPPITGHQATHSTTGPPTGRLLPSCRTHWPAEAATAHRALTRQLDAWCREHGHPSSTNSSIAEEAVRRTWAG